MLREPVTATDSGVLDPSGVLEPGIDGRIFDGLSRETENQGLEEPPRPSIAPWKQTLRFFTDPFSLVADARGRPDGQ